LPIFSCAKVLISTAQIAKRFKRRIGNGIIGKQHFIDQDVLYLPTMAIWAILSVVAGITGSERYHRFWSVFFPCT
jgi:hypothetical protein